MASVIKSRQHDLKVVLENIHDPHNVSAIFRTCDAVGVPLVSLVYTFEKFPKIGKKSSASAYKWVNKEKFTSIPDCYADLRAAGYKIYATALNPDAVSIYDIDFTEKAAIVLGNEHRGVSDEAVEFADASIYIPMFGMVQSLNVSVATAIVLYEALRQRYRAEKYVTDIQNPEELEELIKIYLGK